MTKNVLMYLLAWDRDYLRKERNPKYGKLYATPFEWLSLPNDGNFLDGPVSPRVAVLDFEKRGTLKPGVKFLPQGVGKTVSCYDVEIPDAWAHTNKLMKATESDEFIYVNSFATVMKTVKFFESSDALGRPIKWAFNSPQLLVLPRAGLLANAFYDRESGSLQFFYFPSTAGYMIYTSLSQHIIVHETVHAILDSVAPDLYHATRTQSLAIHEAVADLAAILFSLMNDMLVFSIFAISAATVDITTAFSGFAEEFGTEMRREVGAEFLRVLNNQLNLDTNSVDLTNQYEVGLVLSGAIYQVFLKAYERQYFGDEEDFIKRKTKRILKAARDVARMVFRGLDYLPPGEVSLADYARAMIAAHRAVKADKRLERWLVNELVRRKVVKNQNDLQVYSDFVGKEIKDANCQELLENQDIAKRFVEKHRDLFRIPSHIRSDFKVEPRRKRIREQKGNRKEKVKSDLIFRVSWDSTEEHDLGSRFASKWRYPVGTTLVLEWGTGKILSILTTDQGKSHHSDRDRTLRRWIKQGLLMTPEEAVGLDGEPLVDKIIAKKTGRTMAVTGSARVLCT